MRPSGSRWWRFDYARPDVGRNTLSLGTYPDTSLKDAREKRDEARKQLANGIDPGAKRQSEKVAQADSFESVGREWFDKFSPDWAPNNSKKIIRALEKDVFPWIGRKPIGKLTAPELLTVLQRIESRGAIESAHRAHQYCGRIIRFAIATNRAERDCSADLRGAIPPPKSTHYSAITTAPEAGGLLRAIDSYAGSFIVRCALKFVALTATRSGELRGATWGEIDTHAGKWTIPAGRMKGRAEHVVMLSKQALAVLEELHPLTGSGASSLVFPGERSNKRPLSDNSLNAALRRMGFGKDVMTTHGFRSLFSTMANEHGWNPDVIERTLAHAPKDEIRAAYHRSQYLPERKKLAQWWADHLDALRLQVPGSNVIAFAKRLA